MERPRPYARVCVAQVGAPHGVRGEVRLKPFTADPLAIKRYGTLASEDGARRFRVVSLRHAKDMLIARLEGIDDRDAAEALRNARLYVPRDRLPALDEDEFYHVDLISLAVFDPAGAKLGTVVAVHNFGAGDLIEFQPEGGRATVLLPFTKAVVPEIDIAGGRLTLDPPEGMFDEAERLAREPSPLVGEGGEQRSCEPGEGAGLSAQADVDPSPGSSLSLEPPSPTRGEGNGASGGK